MSKFGPAFDRALQVFIGLCAALGLYIQIWGVPNFLKPAPVPGASSLMETPNWVWGLYLFCVLLFIASMVRIYAARHPKPYKQKLIKVRAGWKTPREVIDETVSAEIREDYAGAISVRDEAAQEIEALKLKLTAVRFGEILDAPKSATPSPEAGRLKNRIGDAVAISQAAGLLASDALERSKKELKEKLISGKLVAKGFLLPHAAIPEQALIPADHWILLQFARYDETLQKASIPNGSSYEGIMIGVPK